MVPPIRLLVIFSDPPGNARLRLDKEDKVFANLSHRYGSDVFIERAHASEIEDIHQILSNSYFDIIHFSGHGDENGIFLDRFGVNEGAELVGAIRIRSLLSIPDRPPSLLVFLSCYSDSSVATLAECASFVITATGAVKDDCCIEFSKAFYPKLFAGSGIQSAFESSINVLLAKDMRCSPFQISRRSLILRDGSYFIQSVPDSHHDNLLINLDHVADKLKYLPLPEEEVLHLISRKLSIHRWIFSVPRERCTIPIGRLLFGEFSWEDASDVIYCKAIRKLNANVPLKHWEIWHKLLIAYNDLASSEYRILDRPASEENAPILQKAIKLFNTYIRKYLLPAKEGLLQLGRDDLVPYIEFIASYCDMAEDHASLERLSHVVKTLEEALTTWHDLVDGLRPDEEK